MSVRKRFFGGNWISYLYGAAIFLEHSSDLMLSVGFVEDKELQTIKLKISVKRFQKVATGGTRKAEILANLEIPL